MGQENVIFSSKTKLYIGKYGTARAALAFVGLIGQDIKFKVSQTFRTKKDGFPEVVVAQAIQSQSADFNAVLREWRPETIKIGFGLDDTDCVVTNAGAVNITDAKVKLNADRIGVLPSTPDGVTPLVVNTGTNAAPGVALVLGTDFIVGKDAEGRTQIILLPGNTTVLAGQTIYVDFLSQQFARLTIFPIGKDVPTRYRSVLLKETMTDGSIRSVFMPKASIGLSGDLEFFAVEAGGDIPVTVTAVQDTTYDALAYLEYQEASA